MGLCEEAGERGLDLKQTSQKHQNVTLKSVGIQIQMEPITIFDKNPFNPTPKLKSSSLINLFIAFNINDEKCGYCGNYYSLTLLSQKYCKHCFFQHIKYAANSIDVCINTNKNTLCYEHKPSSINICTQNIQEWCESCSEVSHFNQIITKSMLYKNCQEIINNEKVCKLCGKLIYKSKNIEFRLCSDCYQISSEWIESTLAEKPILNLYLPWWDANNQCIVCNQFLKFKSNCQKWCSNCIIIYVGCRYCLMTNIIFGITDITQCKKCKRKSFIITDIKNFTGKFLNLTCYVNYTNNNPLEIYSHIEFIIYLGNNGDSTIPIIFIPFYNEDKCHFCKEKYSVTLLFDQKYCKYCLILYINYITNSDDSIDLCISTNNNIICRRHELRGLDFSTQNIQEWCEDCSEISHFNQIITKSMLYKNYQKIIDNGKVCKLCGKLIYKSKNIEFTLCSNCYQISFGWTESILAEKSIPILYLPWWNAYDQCIVCNQLLELKSNCQKWCSYCIIIYVGCRYCLMTNIIFGITDITQCNKCKRKSFITTDIKNFTKEFYGISVRLSFNSVLEYVSEKINANAYNHNQIINYVNNIDKNSNPLEIYNYIKKINYLSQITDLKSNGGSFSLNIPIMFIPFNNNEDECHYCKRKYSLTLLFDQKYCEHCLILYIKDTTNSVDSVDVCISTNNNIICHRHELRDLDFCTQNIQEWCESCSEISHFNQIVTKSILDKNYQKLINNGEDCKLCGKLIHKKIFSKNIEFKLCSADCYQISFTRINSNLISIINLPWWDTYDHCIVCYQFLKFKTNCQKWCSNCIIIYVGCRYCLTTNIIFGITDQSQCKKCKRKSFITIDISETYNNINEFPYFTKFYINNQITEIADYINNFNKNSNNILNIYSFIKDIDIFFPEPSAELEMIKLIPYSQIKDLEEIAKGGTSVIYKAFNNENIVAIKKFDDFNSEYFFNEVTFYF
ncbi:hypothetical protein C1645_818683 [Glomus cerebriforme]|uniref:Protein kinase domain-containing protein n=1 Tax=Glomus cerebriforme TaxID=658196 RepID=A0A397T6T6_9GLOM|nr:hypothetical protein C1645_818683 [Glomus cerebriforme]